MKARHGRSLSVFGLLLMALAAFVPAPVASAGDGPQLDAVRAAKIATDYLATLGSTAPHIVSVTLEKSALLHGRLSWVARWSRAVEVEGEKEVGLRVNLDGSTARLVEDKAAAGRRAAKAGMH